MANLAISHGEAVVVVIGSGAGGGTLANELTQRGVDTVVLEAGSRLDLEDFLADEWGDAEGPWETVNWRDKRLLTGNSPVVPDYSNSPTWVLKTVGGTTVHWAAQGYRFTDHEWRPLSRYGPIHGANMLDWPMDLESLTPYYESAERKMRITGRNGVPFLPHTRLYEIFAAGCRALGYSDVFEGHIAVDPRGRDVPMDRKAWGELEERSKRIARLSGLDAPHVLVLLQGCSGGPKWSALNSEIPEAEKAGHCEVRPNCMALQIQHDRSGKVTGVLYADASGTQQVQKARVVCIAGNAIESPRLLLNSASSQFPDGLANSSGQVGRNYLRNTMAFVYGQFDDPVNMVFGNPVPGIIFTEDRGAGYAGALSFAGMGYGMPLYTTYGKEAVVGRSYAEAMPYMAGVIATGNDLPMERNGIALHATEKDGYGLPIPVINMDIHPNEAALEPIAIGRASDILNAAGARRIIACPPLPSSHNLGTNRMSRNPRDGVCNEWGRAHDVANVFISDGSQFSSANVGHPTLTIVALAIRQAEHIAEAMRRGEL